MWAWNAQEYDEDFIGALSDKLHSERTESTSDRLLGVRILGSVALRLYETAFSFRSSTSRLFRWSAIGCDI